MFLALCICRMNIWGLAMKIEFSAKDAKIHPNSDILLVAQWFVEKAEMSHKKIQKLCFYAEVWSLLELGKDIVPEIRFEAWVHGPVCPRLYDELKNFGWRDIMIAEEFRSLVEKDLDKNLSSDQKRILQFVWDAYGDLTADELESLTHKEDPWKNARKGLRMFDSSQNEITSEAIIKYYSEKYAEFI